MNVFGLGPGELILVLTLALIVFGPKKLPEIGAGLGKAIGQFKKATNDLTQEINKEMQADGIKELASLKDVPRDLRGLATSVYQSAQTPATKPSTPKAASAATAEEKPAADATTGDATQAAAQEDASQVAPETVPDVDDAPPQTASDAAPKPRSRLKVREETSPPAPAPEA